LGPAVAAEVGQGVCRVGRRAARVEALRLWPLLPLRLRSGFEPVEQPRCEPSRRRGASSVGRINGSLVPTGRAAPVARRRFLPAKPRGFPLREVRNERRPSCGCPIVVSNLPEANAEPLPVPLAWPLRLRNRRYRLW